MEELFSLGFREADKCEEALRMSGGEVRGALSFLQRPLLEEFHKRVWSDLPEPTIDIKDPDRQVPDCGGGAYSPKSLSLAAGLIVCPSLTPPFSGCAGGCWLYTACPAGGAVSWRCPYCRSPTPSTPWKTYCRLSVSHMTVTSSAGSSPRSAHAVCLYSPTTRYHHLPMCLKGATGCITKLIITHK